MTALALSLAYLGTLGFAAWLLWLRRNAHERARDENVTRLLARMAQVEARADPGDLAKRLEVLERRAATADLTARFGGR